MICCGKPHYPKEVEQYAEMLFDLGVVEHSRGALLSVLASLFEDARSIGVVQEREAITSLLRGHQEFFNLVNLIDDRYHYRSGQLPEGFVAGLDLRDDAPGGEE